MLSRARFYFGILRVGVIGLVLAELRSVVARSKLCSFDLFAAEGAGLSCNAYFYF